MTRQKISEYFEHRYQVKMFEYFYEKISDILKEKTEYCEKISEYFEKKI